MATKPPANLDHVWNTPGLSSAAANEKRVSNLASLKRKISYCLGRPGEPLQYQSVEGWSGRQVLEFMQSSGIPTERIKMSFDLRNL